MKQFMPQTYVTFIICTLALVGLFPFAGFWSKDEILAGAGQLGGTGAYTRSRSSAPSAPLMTAAYMTRCVYLTFFGEFRGGHHAPHEAVSHGTEDHPVVEDHLADDSDHADSHVEERPTTASPTSPARASWCRSTSCRRWPSSAGLANLPNNGIFSWVPDGIALRFEHFFEPKAAYFPSFGAIEGALAHPEFALATALISTAVVVARLRPRLRLVLQGHRAARHHPAQPAGPGRPHAARQQVLLRPPLHRRSSPAGSRARSPGRQLVQPERPRRRRQRRRHRRRPSAAGSSTTRSTRSSSTASSTAPGIAAEGGGQVFRQMQTGKVQQYAAHPLRRHRGPRRRLHHRHLAAPPEIKRHDKDFIHDWGLTRHGVRAARRRGPHDAVPQGRRGEPTSSSRSCASLVTAGVRHRGLRRLRLRPDGRPAVRAGQRRGSTSSTPATRSASTACPCRWSPSRC